MTMKLVFATNNAHKLEEVRAILGSGYEVLSLREIGCTADIPETADTFEGNALQKAHYVKEHFGYDCFADDTGLEVAALDGAPGVHSARYAGDHDSDANCTKLLAELQRTAQQGNADRSARFRTVVALILNGEEHLFEGIVSGTITTATAASATTPCSNPTAIAPPLPRWATRRTSSAIEPEPCRSSSPSCRNNKTRFFSFLQHETLPSPLVLPCPRHVALPRHAFGACRGRCLHGSPVVLTL